MTKDEVAAHLTANGFKIEIDPAPMKNVLRATVDSGGLVLEAKRLRRTLEENGLRVLSSKETDLTTRHALSVVAVYDVHDATPFIYVAGF